MCCYRSLIFNCCFCDTDVSQGRPSVATHLRCGGNFSDTVITFFLILEVKKIFLHRSIFDEVKAYGLCCQFFFGPPCNSSVLPVSGVQYLV